MISRRTTHHKPNIAPLGAFHLPCLVGNVTGMPTLSKPPASDALSIHDNTDNYGGTGFAG